MKKVICFALLIALAVLTLASCARTEEHALWGTYSRPNANGNDAFTITLNEDGTYTYFETMISSHLGHGTYSFDGNVVAFDDSFPGVSGSISATFKFKFENGKLIFLADSSDRFMYINLPDGAIFEKVTSSDTVGNP